MARPCRQGRCGRSSCCGTSGHSWPPREESDGNPPRLRTDPRDLRAGGRRAAHSADAWPSTPPTSSRTPPRRRTWPASPWSSRNRTATGVLEIAVHPSYRNQGVADRLVGDTQAVRGLDGLKAWSHGNHEAAADLAARYGYGAGPGAVEDAAHHRGRGAARRRPPGGRHAARLCAGPGRGRLAGGQPGRLRPPPGAGRH